VTIIPKDWPPYKNMSISIKRTQYNELKRRKKERLFAPNISEVCRNALDIILFDGGEDRETLVKLLSKQKAKQEVASLGKRP